MERSGTLSEPSDNSTTPYIKKRDQPFWVSLDFKAFGKDFSSLKNYRYQGWMAGAGIGYGYDWALSRHFNLEFELGMGVIYTGYEKYDCPQCGKKVDENQKFMIAPTKAALSLVYLF